MADNIPNMKSSVANSDIQSGRDTHIGDVTHKYYFQGKSVEIPRRLTNFIPVNADHILGRETEMAEIEVQLNNKRPSVLVNGVGGMGKTSVATKFMVERSTEYKHLAWLTVSGTVLEAFINNEELKNSLYIKEEVNTFIFNKNIDGAFKHLFKKLNDLEKTLIILDNANDFADLLQYQHLFETAKCHILITSRTQPQSWQMVKIERLDDAEALALFRKYAPHIIADDTPILALLKHLDFHTLLIELIAKSAHASAISFEKLEAIIQKNFIHDELLQKRKVETGEHGKSLEDNTKRAKIEDYIWLIFQNIADISEPSKAILKAMALLPIATAYDDNLLEELFTFFNIKEEIFELLDHIVERGWLDVVREDGQVKYKMHPLIADVVIKKLEVNVDFAEDYINRIANLINYENTNTEHNLFEIKQYQPLAERLSDLFFEENKASVSDLLDRLGNLDENFGFYQKAAFYGERTLEIAESIFEPNNDTIAVRQSNLAAVYKNLGNYEAAATLLETALESVKKKFGIEHPTIPAYQSNLATVYTELGNYEAAATLLETALESVKKKFGTKHPTVAVCQSNLANVYSDLGKYKAAAALLEIALQSDLNNFGADHPTVAVRQSNLANVYSDLGKYEAAAALLEIALQSDLKNFGADHPTVAVRQSNLALVYKALGKYEAAAVLLEIALQSDLKNFGADHPNVAVCQSNLAMVYKELGKYEAAAALLKIALKSDLKNFSADHPTVAVRQNNLAIVYYETGQKAEAKTLWQAAYQNYLKNLGETHPNTILFKQYAEMQD